jgi:GT2 family glycosyltransferase
MGEELLTTESTRPLLTIAIPNFNRAGYLKELSLLAAQLRNEPRAELIISDNASPDETRRWYRILWLVDLEFVIPVMFRI